MQDDNLNVSSSLASLSTRCSSEIIALLTNVTELQKKMEGVQIKLEGEEQSENFVQNKQAVITKEVTIVLVTWILVMRKRAFMGQNLWVETAEEYCS